MADVHAYFDESGTHDGSPVLCVAGYLIQEDRRQAFNSTWNQILERKRLTHFHMVDCAHGNGEFANLSKNERVEVQTKLIELIMGSSARGIGAMVVASVYEQLMPFHPNYVPPSSCPSPPSQLTSVAKPANQRRQPDCPQSSRWSASPA